MTQPASNMIDQSNDTNNKLVWFPDPASGFALGQLINVGQTSLANVQPMARPAATSVHFEPFATFASKQQQQQVLEFPFESVFPCDQFLSDNKQLEALLQAAQIGGLPPTGRRDQARDNSNLGRPGVINDVDDSCALIQLHEAALLENVRIRFHCDKIYTYVAHILIAVNPYVEIKSLRSAETIAQYQGKSLGTLPPHVYAIADKAYRDMKAFKQSQSIIISGESGAGKTESQKYVLRYLCLSGSQSGRLEKLILDANPLLEAFGNAKTIRNNNSSRFGKFIEIHYANKFQVTGGLFHHYLLEKSRICKQSLGERNYHIFYQLCACLPDKYWRQLELGPPDKFRYLNQGCTQYFCAPTMDNENLASERKSRDHLRMGAIQDQLIDDFECYKQTDQALSNFGLNLEQKLAIYSIVAAVLHLGNIEFCDNDDESGNSVVNHNDEQQQQQQQQQNNHHRQRQANHNNGCHIAPQSEAALKTTAQLIGLEADLLQQALISRIMSTARGGHKGTVYMVHLTSQQAQAARDALAKAIYSKLFDYLVQQIINKSIPSISGSSYYIGVLDVAGFEYFEHNDFEQFLINFCNEKLQQFFNERILKEEQCIYEMEGLGLAKVDFVDNQDCIQLFETKSMGIFDLLDEESRLPRPDARHFTQAVHSINLNNNNNIQKQNFSGSNNSSNHHHHHQAVARLALPRTSKVRAHREIRDDEGFLIRHFAGSVCYETKSFIEKNNDALHGSLKTLMADADNELLRNLFASSPPSSLNTNASPQNTSDNNNKASHHQPNYSRPSPLINLTTSAAAGQPNNNKLSFVSVATTFRSQLQELMDKLQSTGSHFIRCIKPNGEMIAHKFEGNQILSQLHCSGMDSVLKLMQQGYPSRVSFNDLYQAYAHSMPTKLARLDARLFCRCLFKAIGLADTDFRFGSSKVFFKPAKFAEFDQIIRTTDREHVNRLLEQVSKWLVKWRWRKAQYCCLSVIKLHRKLIYRREKIIELQKMWRGALIRRRIKFRLAAIASARQIDLSLQEFGKITQQDNKSAPISGAKQQPVGGGGASAQLAPLEREQLEQESRLLREELGKFVGSMHLALQQQLIECANDKTTPTRSSELLREEQSECRQKLELLRTKRELLVRSIRDKIAQRKDELEQLERQLISERRQLEAAEVARCREVELKRQHEELELRRQDAVQAQQLLELEQLEMVRQKSMATTAVHNSKPTDHYRRQCPTTATDSVDSSTDPMSGNFLELDPRSAAQLNVLMPLAPSENLANVAQLNVSSRLDLTKWKYSDLRDTINTSCDLELLEACKREFHRRLKVYHAWRAMNSPSSSSAGHKQQQHQQPSTIRDQRAPSCIMNTNSAEGANFDRLKQPQAPSISADRCHEQRYFRIPFLRQTAPATSSLNNNNNNNQRGWWFAHFDGQWIARQLELHPNREPILLIAGQHDIDMCELSLEDTRLTSKRGAEILEQEFEAEWRKHGGRAYPLATSKANRSSAKS